MASGVSTKGHFESSSRSRAALKLFAALCGENNHSVFGVNRALCADWCAVCGDVRIFCNFVASDLLSVFMILSSTVINSFGVKIG